jgi:hypothetical protein
MNGLATHPDLKHLRAIATGKIAKASTSKPTNEANVASTNPDTSIRYKKQRQEIDSSLRAHRVRLCDLHDATE